MTKQNSEQSAREHEAWEALRNGDVDSVILCSDFQARFMARTRRGETKYRADPVDAVLALVNAEKSEGKP